MVEHMGKGGGGGGGGAWEGLLTKWHVQLTRLASVPSCGLHMYSFVASAYVLGSTWVLSGCSTFVSGW